MRIVQISDTHISHYGGITSDNFEILAKFVNEVVRPDLVVNSGDVSILTPDSPEDRATAIKLHKAFEAPVRILPGNHDLGEAGDHAWMGLNVTSARLAAFKESYGTDRFLEFDGDDFAIVGMDSEILASGLPEEGEQWDWLGEVARETGERSVLLFLHKPLHSPLPGFTEHALAIDEPSRDRLLGLFGTRLKAVGSGHLHRYWNAFENDLLQVWAPSTAFIVKSAAWKGLNQIGIVEWRIEGREIEAYFRSVPSVIEDEPFSMPAFTDTMAEITAAQGASA